MFILLSNAVRVISLIKSIRKDILDFSYYQNFIIHSNVTVLKRVVDAHFKINDSFLGKLSHVNNNKVNDYVKLFCKTCKEA